MFPEKSENNKFARHPNPFVPRLALRKVTILMGIYLFASSLVSLFSNLRKIFRHS